MCLRSRETANRAGAGLVRGRGWEMKAGGAARSCKALGLVVKVRTCTLTQ